MPSYWRMKHGIVKPEASARFFQKNPQGKLPRKWGIIIEEENEFRNFWKSLTENLMNDIRCILFIPLQEMRDFNSRFPDNIIQCNVA